MFFFLFPLIKSVFRCTRFEDVAVQQVIAEIPVNSYRECFLLELNAAESVFITRDTILRGNFIVLCANKLASNDETAFSYWCAGLRNLTLP